ncbi:hypothetical protein AAHA92_08108 [Salvia divinorum]|uniref:Uncharacterized protein n=1 Tax=Salvia divinorum TaxID=28513 RepID=A0ABD1HN48_SALDI
MRNRGTFLMHTYNRWRNVSCSWSFCSQKEILFPNCSMCIHLICIERGRTQDGVEEKQILDHLKGSDKCSSEMRTKLWPTYLSYNCFA